jgi:hypothetical protein
MKLVDGIKTICDSSIDPQLYSLRQRALNIATKKFYSVEVITLRTSILIEREIRISTPSIRDAKRRG